LGRWALRVSNPPPRVVSTILRIYLYGYLNRLQSSRRLEWEARRDIELMWLNTI
jgi:transposase